MESMVEEGGSHPLVEAPQVEVLQSRRAQIIQPPQLFHLAAKWLVGRATGLKLFIAGQQMGADHILWADGEK